MKIKEKIKDNYLTVTIKLSSDEKINERELDRFSRIFLRGFLKPKLLKKDLVEYKGPGTMSLVEWFKKPVQRRDVLFVLEQIIITLQKLRYNKLPLNYLLLSPQHVYFNDVTKEVQFVYIPTVAPFDNSNAVKLFFDIAQSIKAGNIEDSAFIKRYNYCINNLRPFDFDIVEKFIASEDESVVTILRRQNSGQSGYMTNKPKDYYARKQDVDAVKNEEKTGLLVESAPSEPDSVTSNYNSEPINNIEYQNKASNTVFADVYEKTGIITDNNSFGNIVADGNLNTSNSDFTMPVNDSISAPVKNITAETVSEINTVIVENREKISTVDEDDTNLLVEPNNNTIINDIENEEDEEGTCLLVDDVLVTSYPLIYRVLTGENIPVNKPVFRLGKERNYVDYFVFNNNAVSRNHADIITRGNRYFVKDLNSKNHTYINDKIIPVNMEIEIKRGDVFKLGNEKFVFKG